MAGFGKGDCVASHTDGRGYGALDASMTLKWKTWVRPNAVRAALSSPGVTCLTGWNPDRQGTRLTRLPPRSHQVTGHP